MITRIVFAILLFFIAIPSVFAYTPSGNGSFIVNSCSVITNPISGYTWCILAGSNPPSIYEYLGGIYVSIATSSNYSPTGAAPLNLTGTDSVDCSRGNFQKLILQANETLTLTCSAALVTNQFVQLNYEICQNSTGNFSLGFGSTPINWSNQTQRGYTVTAHNCDFYSFRWNGTNFLDVGFNSNVLDN
jgi:hypothetical protein